MPIPVPGLSAAVLALVTVASPLFAESQEPPWPTKGWLTAEPAEVSLDPVPLQQLSEDAQAGRFPDLHSLLIIKDGRLAYEEYLPGGSRDQIHTLQSVSKSVTSTLVGIALQRQRLDDLEASLISFFPQYTIAHLDDRKRSITLEHVLRMRLGMEWEEQRVPYETDANSLYRLNHHTGDWYRLVLDTPMEAEPGERFRYNSGGTILLAGVLDRVTGMRTDEFARAYLFDPLGIGPTDWTVIGGVTHTGGGLSMRARDMAKLGYLYLRDGVWEGERILPEGWVRWATSGRLQAQAPGALPIGYGFLWWLLPAHADMEADVADAAMFTAWGHMGQFIFVAPAYDLVFVTTGGAEEFVNETRPFDIFYDYVIPAADPAVAFRPAADETQSAEESVATTFGGPGRDRGIAVATTADGGTVAVGTTTSSGAGGEDVYFVCTDAQGRPRFERTIGGPENDCGWSVLQMEDEGFVIAGFTDSFGAGGTDAYLIRTNADGDTLWTRTYGGPEDDLVWSLLRVEDGFVLAGQTASAGAGDFDFHLLRTDLDGRLRWQRTYGGPAVDRAFSVQRTEDGGFVLGGITYSFGAGDRDGWVVKTDGEGNELWNRTLGSEGYDVVHSVSVGSALEEPGCFAIGYTSGLAENGGQDAWIVRLDPRGEPVWSAIFGGPGNERLMNGVPTEDGGIACVGYVQTPHGLDAYLAEVGPTGEVEWTRTRGGLSEDSGYGITRAPSGDLIVTGLTHSSGAGEADLWLFRLDPEAAAP